MEEQNLENLDFFDDIVDDDDTQNQDLDQHDDNQDQNNDDQNHDQDQDNQDDEDIVSAYLRSKGIDPKSVKFENEDGETEEVNFNDLTREEQLQLLNYNPDEQEEPELMEDEERLLNILRSNNMSVKDYLNAYGKHVIAQYQSSLEAQQEPEYDIDEYSDDELFIADLKSKVPDLTEEEALQALEQEKQNPDLFNKKMGGIRAQYQQREQSMREYQMQQQQAQMQQQAAEFERVIVDTIQNNNNIDLGDTSLELSEDDMNEIASFILDSDAAGVRHIAKALNDPKMLVEMAWWALKGHEALNQVTQYYKRQIAEARRSAKTSGAVSKEKPRTVVTPKGKKQNESRSNSNQINDDFDLYDNLI